MRNPPGRQWLIEPFKWHENKRYMSNIFLFFLHFKLAKFRRKLINAFSNWGGYLSLAIALPVNTNQDANIDWHYAMARGSIVPAPWRDCGINKVITHLLSLSVLGPNNATQRVLQIFAYHAQVGRDREKKSEKRGGERNKVKMPPHRKPRLASSWLHRGTHR